MEEEVPIFVGYSDGWVGINVRIEKVVGSRNARQIGPCCLFDGREPDRCPCLSCLGDKKGITSSPALALLVFDFCLG